MPKWIRNLINKNKALEILVENYNVRTIVFSLLSVLVAIGLTVFNIVILCNHTIALVRSNGILSYYAYSAERLCFSELL